MAAIGSLPGGGGVDRRAPRGCCCVCALGEGGMRDCPQCGASVDGMACASCGFGQDKRGGGERRKTVRINGVEIAAVCCSVPGCDGIGTISHTLGGGPWFCREHARSTGALPTRDDRAKARNVFCEIRSLLQRKGPRIGGPLSAANEEDEPLPPAA